MRERGQFNLFGQIGVIIGKAPDMHRRHPGQTPQNMVRADLVPRLGGKGCGGTGTGFRCSSQPLAIHGPIRLATGKGSFFHMSIRREWVALVGSASRLGAPGAVHTP
jgi:hypothetical protein